MKFVIVEVQFKFENETHSYPAIVGDNLFKLVSCLNDSNKVKAYKVIDTYPVEQSRYGWGCLDKWVTEFNFKE